MPKLKSLYSNQILQPAGWESSSRRAGSSISIWTPGCLLLGLMALNLEPGLNAAPVDQEADALPPAVNRQVDFSTEVLPIFEAACIRCHGRGKHKGEFRLDSREALLSGGDSGDAVKLGDSAGSYLIHLVAGTDPDDVMPQKGNRLTEEEVGILRAWVDQGAPWGEGVSLGRKPPVNFDAVAQPLPEVGPKHPVDRWIAQYDRSHGIEVEGVVEDRVFARRVYLDVIGLLPTPEEMSKFLNDTGSDKRERLVDHLLSDQTRYTTHWLTFWNDHLRNDYRGTGYIDGGRKQITQWLYDALYQNKPYNQFVRELISPTPESEGFIKGIVWRGDINSSQTAPMQAARSVSQVFMGVNLKCASCHDSFIDDWRLEDAYGLASVFADKPLQMYECDKPTGLYAKMAPLYSQLGSIDPEVPRAERLEQLAEALTSKKNGRLTRTLVNRIWARFFGRGLVEPLDVMENPAWHPELLNWLAEDFVANEYDLKHLMRTLLTSQAYQRPSVALDEEPVKPKEDFVFGGPTLKRMGAEVFVDAVYQFTKTWPEKTDANIQLPGKGTVAGLDGLRWIWSSGDAAVGAPPETVYFRKTFHLDHLPEMAWAIGSADNSFELFVNGQSVLKSSEWNQAKSASVRNALQVGQNVLAVRASNGGSGSNPAGFIFGLASGKSAESEELTWTVVSDESWKSSTKQVEDWKDLESSSCDWGPTFALGGLGIAPWNFAGAFSDAASQLLEPMVGRAALLNADPLMVCLGRPNREQIMTRRSSAATTLQGLEMANGNTLHRLFARGAAKWMESGEFAQNEVEPLVRAVFKSALSRDPSADEMGICLEVLGDHVAVEELQDFMWSVAMLPEFQVVR